MDNIALYGDLSNYGSNNGNYSSAGARPTNPSSGTYAQDTRAWVTRSVYDDYETRFQPFEKKMIDSAMGGQMLDERLSAIKINNKQSFEASALSNQQDMARYGMTQSSDQKASYQKNQSLEMGKATANANNQTRRHVDDRNLAVIGGGQMRQAIGGQ